MSSPLSDLVDNLSDGFYSYDCPDCKFQLDYMIIKNNKVIFRCSECKKNHSKDFDNELIKRFANIYEFCNEDINKFMLLLRKGICPYEYMDSWERFDETLLSDEKHFYSKLTIENITDRDHKHAKRVFKSFNNKNLGDYHDLYVQSNTLLLADIFENFRKQYIEIYELDPSHFLTEP